jgi:hypothetical protein
MRTDPEWGMDCWRLYAQIVFGRQRATEKILGQNRQFLSGGREAYFAAVLEEIPETVDRVDFFLDPDTGLETQSGRSDKRHVRFDDVKDILKQHPTSTIVIYQHRYRTEDYLVHVVNRTKEQGLVALGYYGGSVSMVFIGLMDERLALIRSRLGTFAGPKSDERVIVPSAV